MDDLYQENILDHYRNPRNYGQRDKWVSDENGQVFQSGQSNPSCGDSLEMAVWVKDEKINKVRFVGQGCAISVASASMLTEKVLGAEIEEIMKIDYEDVEKMLGVMLSTERKKCAYLCLVTLKRILDLVK